MFDFLRKKQPQPKPPRSMTVGLILRPRGDDCAAAVSRLGHLPLPQRTYFDFDRQRTEYGARDEDIELVRGFADKHGLEVVEVNPDSRLVLLTGPPLKVTIAFNVSLEFERLGERLVHFLSGDTSATLEYGELAEAVESIFGLDSRPDFDILHFSLRRLDLPWRSERSNVTAPDEETLSLRNRIWTDPRQIQQRYRFPQETGKGQTIGIVTLGGGFYEEDMKEFFGDAMPEIEVVTIGEAKNDPASRDDIRRYLKALRGGSMPEDMSDQLVSQCAWTLETAQDLQLAGSFAPDAKLVLYIGENNELGQVRSLLAALHDRKRDIDVLSCSWGTGEGKVDPKLAKAVEETLQLAALRGVTVCCASGDKGGDVVNDEPNAHFPSSCPTALSCGGTTPKAEDHVADEVWNESRGPFVAASGGGFSRLFDMPDWQHGTGGDKRPTGRGVPDVAAKADLTEGYRMVAGGEEFSGGGTSASTPVWASLVARCNQSIGHRCGWFSPLIYQQHLTDALRRVEEGNNGLFYATDHWDACTGWGTPNGDRLVKLLSGHLLNEGETHPDASQ